MVNGTEVGVPNGVYAFFKTSQGEILVRLYHNATPLTVGNFVSLAEGTNTMTNVKQGQPYYDGIVFHRVIPDFMIQGGDPQGNGSGGPGYSFPDEFVDTLIHDRAGILSMANAGPGTNGSQFFITDKPTPHLNGRHTVFGEVMGGLDIVAKIARVPRGRNDRPNTPVVMESVKIYRIGEDAKEFNGAEALEDGIAEIEAAKRRKEMLRVELGKNWTRAFDWYDDGVLDQEEFKEEYVEWREDDMEKTESGLGYIVLDEGDGPEVRMGDLLEIDYVGYTTDGKIFDSSLEEMAVMAGVYNPQRPYQPLRLSAGTGQVIQGWIEATLMFKKGTHIRLIIPPNLAWGSREAAGGAIPPNSTVIFDMYIHE
ncbi:peptidylprolyl isomerase [Phaeocystidibacter luteus]|uniref:peptidylprolyl isomerase n=2 Tax=Phaeocystidibacter luteus TaxID=911197 RepID=A0A6N6RMU2_9FLAO|nr:peptidylprolyl isomerase [Phaeocystidibacter luteus]